MCNYYEIVCEICEYFNEDSELVISNSRKIKGRTSMIRGLCIYILREVLGATNKQCRDLFHFKYVRDIQRLRSNIAFYVECDEQYKKEYNLLKENKPHIFQ